MNDYLKRLENAIGHIESNLDKPMTLEHIASASFLSSFHFERVFRALTGETVFSYVRKRRLSQAFDMVLGTDQPIIDIALENGYESAAAFSRAFSAQFKINPSTLRARRKRNIIGYYPAMDRDRLSHRLQGGITMEAAITKKGPVILAGLRCENTAKKNDIPKLWFKFIGQAKKIPGFFDRGTYGVYMYDFDKPRNEVDENMPFSYLAAGELGPDKKDMTLPPGFEIRILPERTYAVFKHRGRLADLGKTYEYIYGVWFPTSGRESLSAEHFEYHGPDFKGDFPDAITEIWIPLVER